jgi:hypothetical protein
VTLVKSHNFIFSNPFSSIDVRAPSAKDTWLEWTPENFEQGYCVANGLVSFSTSVDDEYEVTIVESDDEAVPEGCQFAVKAPFESEGNMIHIRGGYTDLDLPGHGPYRSIAYFELTGLRLLIRLGGSALIGAKVLHPRHALE